MCVLGSCICVLGVMYLCVGSHVFMCIEFLKHTYDPILVSLKHTYDLIIVLKTYIWPDLSFSLFYLPVVSFTTYIYFMFRTWVTKHSRCRELKCLRNFQSDICQIPRDGKYLPPLPHAIITSKESRPPSPNHNYLAINNILFLWRNNIDLENKTFLLRRQFERKCLLFYNIMVAFLYNVALEQINAH